MKPQDPLADVCSVSSMKLCGSQDFINFFGKHRRVKAVTLQCTDPSTAGGNIAKGKYHFPTESGSIAEGQHIASPRSCVGQEPCPTQGLQLISQKRLKSPGRKTGLGS